MDAAQLREAIRILGGDDYIFGFAFDNVGRMFFTSKRPFSSDMIEGEFIKSTAESIDGQTVIELKPIEVIQGIIGVTDPEDRDKIDKQYFRS